jgi:hypothetical protein
VGWLKKTAVLLTKFLRSLTFMLLDWVSFLAYPNLFGIKGFVVVVVITEGKSPFFCALLLRVVSEWYLPL